MVLGDAVTVGLSLVGLNVGSLLVVGFTVVEMRVGSLVVSALGDFVVGALDMELIGLDEGNVTGGLLVTGNDVEGAFAVGMTDTEAKIEGETLVGLEKGAVVVVGLFALVVGVEGIVPLGVAGVVVVGLAMDELGASVRLLTVGDEVFTLSVTGVIESVTGLVPVDVSGISAVVIVVGSGAVCPALGLPGNPGTAVLGTSKLELLSVGLLEVEAMVDGTEITGEALDSPGVMFGLVVGFLMFGGDDAGKGVTNGSAVGVGVLFVEVGVALSSAGETVGF